MSVLVSKKIKVGKKSFQAISMKLNSKTLVVLRGQKGYIMCGYLNMKIADKFNDIAVKITDISNIKEAISARVCSVSTSARKLGIHKGQPIKDVLKIIS